LLNALPAVDVARPGFCSARRNLACWLNACGS